MVTSGLSRYPIAPLDNDVLTIRLCMQRALFVNIAKQNPLPTGDASKAKYINAARRLEEGLLKMAMTNEDYLNPSTLESRLTSLIKGTQLNGHNQQHAITTTPGVSAEPTMTAGQREQRTVRDRDCREAEVGEP